jgi:hypothetical protein
MVDLLLNRAWYRSIVMTDAIIPLHRISVGAIARVMTTVPVITALGDRDVSIVGH